MEKVKIAHVGCGYISQAEHLPAHFLVPTIEVVAIVDARLELAKAVARKFGGKAFANLEQCLASVKVDAVDVVVPDAFHAEVSIQAMEGGKHVLVEKPLARSVSEGKRIVEVAKENHVKLMVAYMRRYDEDCLAVKRMIDHQELGDIAAALSLFKLSYGAHYVALVKETGEKRPEKTERLEDEIPDGPIRNQLIHHLNLLRFWLGEVKRVIVTKFSRNSIQILLEFERGTVCTVNHLNGMGDGEELWVFGDRGNAHLKLWSPHIPYQFPELTVFDRETHRRSAIVTSKSNPYVAEISYFAKCILEDKEPRSSGSDSLKDLELLEEIHKAVVD